MKLRYQNKSTGLLTQFFINKTMYLSREGNWFMKKLLTRNKLNLILDKKKWRLIL